MNQLQKQKYNANFEYVGKVLTSAFESNVLQEKDTTTLSGLMKSVFDMFVYTNSIETDNIIINQMLSDERKRNNDIQLENNKLKKEIERYDKTFKLQSKK